MSGYLIDTSVWIDFLRDRDTKSVQRLSQMIEQGVPFGMTGLIYQEILHGASSELELKRLEKYFSTQRFLHPKDLIQTYSAAANIYFKCRQAGVTIRSTLDCLIAQIAIEHNLILLHSDKDFERIGLVCPELRQET